MNKRLSCPSYKKLRSILEMNEGRSFINVPEKKKNDDNA